jgi:hypothetical protein
MPAAQIDPELLSSVREFASITGVTVQSCLDEAVADWLFSTAVTKMESLQKPRPGLMVVPRQELN